MLSKKVNFHSNVRCQGSLLDRRDYLNSRLEWTLREQRETLGSIGLDFQLTRSRHFARLAEESGLVLTVNLVKKKKKKGFSRAFLPVVKSTFNLSLIIYRCLCN